MIRSTFAGFTTAQLAMSASQRALDVTGQNLSNVNTIGYTRQRLDLASISPVGASIGSSSSDCKVGQGVEMTGISQIRDPFLDIQYRNQLSKVGTADAMDQILNEIGNIFDKTDSTAISNALSDLVTQLTNMSKTESAGQSSADNLVRSATEVLINAIHENATALDRVKTELVSELEKSNVTGINGCIQDILKLNESIKNSQVLGNPALELMDQRNSLIDDLATYLPIDVTYETKKLGGGISVDTLQISFTDTAGNTHSLVSDDKGADLNFTTTGGGVPVSITIKDAKTGVTSPDLSGAIGNGILKGNLDMLNKAEIFDGTDTKGIDYYGKMFDTFVNTFATKLNEMNATVDADGNPVEHPLFTTADGATTGFTAANIKVSDAWMKGDVKITTTKDKSPDGTTNSSAYENVLKMINAISTDKIEFKTDIGGTETKVYTGTFFECYDGLRNTQAIERKASSSILANHATVLNQIADSRDSVSGVYMDEEVMNLMRYQQSYNAAARLMTTLDEALNTLINNTGVVGR